ncbi:hypothetical protein MPTK1_6g15850 [Marchantia polymorpha subsp. ruderalis]|uniref:CBM20 domain-containing protein n=2 Tax=Marchantia polymorpha TaxID=3197 RepID=A0AAF6BSH9_MARPO|nr:hypothetical protein MARPO_0056s0097 [Marchantia polymorpha]BBN14963.1 hypothetical protein Mp_6g15850 [Marchantia polymorpha subsp. ruderalis]|eukprot:PTQ37647.1 hypothetical protein MARPO_0056s0097 [Marchantia polymorpha]
MGNTRSKEEQMLFDENGERERGFDKQLFLSLKVHQTEGNVMPTDYSPYVTGSLPCLGSWNPSKAVALERQTTNMWELSFVIPADHDTLEFKYLLKPKHDKESYILEDGANRVLTGGRMDGDAPPIASFKLPILDPLEFPVTIKADPVSPFTLAASWRLHMENLQSHGTMVRGIPDVSISGVSATLPARKLTGSQALELDLEHYEIPTPASGPTGAQYVANAAEDPRGLQLHRSASVPVPVSENRNRMIKRLDSNVSRDRCVSIKDLVVLGGAESSLPTTAPTTPGESKTVGTDPFSPRFTQDHQGIYVDKGVGSSPRIFRVNTDVSLMDGDTYLDSDETEKPSTNKSNRPAPIAMSANLFRELSTMSYELQDMPEAAGAVAAAAVADRLLGPKERRQLAIVLVGLPARGKTFTAAKLTRYLRWLGHDTKHFNVGKYRRLKHGCSQSADFFRADNQEGVDARNEVAILAMEDMLAWMAEGGQVGVFDATNTTNERRNLLIKLAEGKCKVIFLETICNDRSVIDHNIRLKIQQSPDYSDISDYEVALQDFKTRLENYERVYEPVTEGSYIKMIDMVSGQGGQMQVSNISGYLPGRIVFFLVNTHITPRPILLTRHGESADNVRGRIGGDPVLSEAGEKYASKLSDFVEKRLKTERTASIWTSTLQRTVLTGRHIVGFPKVQWRALDEINAGVCDGMTYEEIKIDMPEEYAARKLDKLRYRYPRGESYLDVIQRLEPVIIELERQRSPVVVIAHQAILRALYAYFADKPLKEVPHIEMPLHTIIEIQMGVTGVQEKRYKLME